jgi:sugar phosphate isomerase/epimerase
MPPIPFLPGLVSITFRKLTANEVIDLAKKAGLAGIEWGGDIHVPHGQVGVAREVAHRTRDAGLACSAYGSYYRLGTPGPDAFPEILQTAVALGTRIIRVWPGSAGSAESDASTRDRVAADGRAIAAQAADAGLTIACEWHGNTLTDTADSAAALFGAVDHPSFQTYWQPPNKTPADACLENLESALPRLAGLHVFHWDEQTVDRRPLSEGASRWRQYLTRAAAAPATTEPRYAMLEFVRDDDPSQFFCDAETLKNWLA